MVLVCHTHTSKIATVITATTWGCEYVARNLDNINIIFINQDKSNAKRAITSFCEICVPFFPQSIIFFLLQSKIESHTFHTLNIFNYDYPLVNSGRILTEPSPCNGLLTRCNKDFFYRYLTLSVKSMFPKEKDRQVNSIS